MDALLEVLRELQLSGGIFLDAEFSAPWCVSSRVGPEDCRPYAPAPAHIIAYHYVTAGEVLLQVAERAPERVGAGRIIVLPRNAPHLLSSAPGLKPVLADDLIQPGADGGLARIVTGGGGATTRILCGYLGCAVPSNPVLRVLPEVLSVDLREAASAAWVETSFRYAAEELVAGRSGSPAVLARLAELLFLEAVRRYLAQLPEQRQGWLAGLRDPVVGRALGLLHSRMREPWTTEALAREAGLSRSAFAERFTRTIGEPPMRYLARARLQFAAQRLRETGEGIARIAYEAGYESEAAFHRAFKREYGQPPAAWRRAAAG